MQYFETPAGEPLPMFFHQNKQRDLTGYSFEHAWYATSSFFPDARLTSFVAPSPDERRRVPSAISNSSSVCVLLAEQSAVFVNSAGLRQRLPLEEVRLPDMAAQFRALAAIKNVLMTGEYEMASLPAFAKVGCVHAPAPAINPTLTRPPNVPLYADSVQLGRQQLARGGGPFPPAPGLEQAALEDHILQAQARSAAVAPAQTQPPSYILSKDSIDDKVTI